MWEAGRYAASDMKITWNTVNGPRTAEVIKTRIQYVVRLDTGRHMIINEESVISKDNEVQDIQKEDR